MALNRTFMIGVMLVCGMLSSAAWGQNHTPGTFFERTPETAQNLPLATPGMFDYDAQLFAPLEFTNGKEPEPNCGFNFSVDRSYISLPRGTQFDSTTGSQVSNGSEFNWGTNYELGWFGEDDKGWNARFDNLTGSFFTNGEDIGAGNPMHVEQKFATFQLNRIFRQNLSNGGYFEPYFGARYMNLSDTSTEDLDVPATPAVAAVPATDTTPAIPATPRFAGFGLRFKQFTGNSTFGFQTGARYNIRRGRWRFTYNGAVAATYNQQRYRTSNFFNDAIQFGQLTGQTNFSDQSFVPIIDGGLDAAYHISRDLSLKMGVNGIYSWNGLARVNTETLLLNGLSDTGTGTVFRPLDENLVAVGFKFGVEWRR